MSDELRFHWTRNGAAPVWNVVDDNDDSTVASVYTNETDAKVVDHVNGDGLDNRRANMRVTDQRGNARNLHPELHGGPDTRVAPTRLTRRRDAGLVRVAS